MSSGKILQMINVGKLCHMEKFLHMRNVETNLSSGKFLHMRKVEKICHVEKFLHMRKAEKICHLENFFHMRDVEKICQVEKFHHMMNIEKNLPWSLHVKKVLHVCINFVAKSLFYAIFAVLSQNLLFSNLRALAWRKIGPKVLSVEKKGQISGTLINWFKYVGNNCKDKIILCSMSPC